MMRVPRPSFLAETPPSAGALLEEHLRVVLLPHGTRHLHRRRVHARPVVLRVVGVVHEQRAVDVREHALVDVVGDDLVEAVEEVFVRGVDLVVACGERVREVQFDDDVCLVVGEVDQIL